MTKRIGVTCDNYKTKTFREGLIKAGFKFEYDGDSGIKNVHLFRIEVAENVYDDMIKKIGRVIRLLDLEFKNSN